MLVTTQNTMNLEGTTIATKKINRGKNGEKMIVTQSIEQFYKTARSLNVKKSIPAPIHNTAQLSRQGMWRKPTQ